MEDIIVEETGTEAIATAAPLECEEEQKLAGEIRELWAEHADAQTTVRKTKAEIEVLRERLSKRLSQMKELLAKPGRKGGWSSFLRAEGIAKATADRLVRKLQESGGQQRNMVNEDVSEPSEADVERLQQLFLPVRHQGRMNFVVRGNFLHRPLPLDRL
jgi:hypothetical protein